MIQRICLLAILIIIGVINLSASEKRLEDLMKEDDYIKASLIVVSPGKALYSAGGHLAIRMACPLQNVDYIYEFDATLNTNESLIFNYLNSNLKGEYIRLFSSDFFNKVHSENRQVEIYPLNLTPGQEIILWSKLDDAVDAKFAFPFSPSHNNCCSMLLSIVDESVQPGLFSSAEVSEHLNGSNRKYLEDFFSNSQWTGLLWNVLLGIDFDKPQETAYLYYPKIIKKYVSLILNPVNHKTLIDRGSDTTIFHHDNHWSITPSFIFVFLLILTVFLTTLNLLGKLTRLSYWFDILLTANTSVWGCVLWYMSLASFFSGTLYFNILMFLFTPLPIALWLLRNKKVWILYIKYIVVISLIYLITINFIPQIQLYCLWALVSVILIRSIYYLYSINHMFNLKPKIL